MNEGVQIREVWSTIDDLMEEADNRVLLQIRDAIECGHNRILLKTVDSDIIIILLGFMVNFKISVEPLCAYIVWTWAWPCTIKTKYLGLINTRNPFLVPKNIEIDNLYNSLIELQNIRYYAHIWTWTWPWAIKTTF